MTYKFFSDAGHGWIKVSIKELEKLKIADKITNCSYMRKESAYLEEDCDLSVFFRAKNLVIGQYDFDKICKTYTSDHSKIRSYECYDYQKYLALKKVINIYDTNETFNKIVNQTLDEKSRANSYFKDNKKYDDLSNNAKTWFDNIVKNIKDELLKFLDMRIKYLVAFNSKSLDPHINEVIQDKKFIEEMEALQ